MSKLNIPRTREAIQAFDFKKLFIDELGWFNPDGILPQTFTLDDIDYQAQSIAELGAVVIF